MLGRNEGKKLLIHKKQPAKIFAGCFNITSSVKRSPQTL